MGGIFAAPPPPPAPHPAPKPAVDTQQHEDNPRRERLERKRRGRRETIATTPRGLLSPLHHATRKPSLLGE